MQWEPQIAAPSLEGKMSELNFKTKMEPEDMAKLPIVGPQPTSEGEEKFLREVCEFEFNNLEEPGAPVKFAYGNSRNNARFYFMHGGKYRVPRFVARHLESCQEPIYKWRPNGIGGLVSELVGHKTRFQMKQTYQR